MKYSKYIRRFSVIHFSLTILIICSCQVNSYGEIYAKYPNWSSNDTSFTVGIAVGNLDGNADLEIVAGNYYYPYTSGTTLPANQVSSWGGDENFGGHLVVYYNGSQEPVVIDSIKRGFNKVLVADINYDGYMDIIAGLINLKGNDAQDCYYLNSGSPTYTFTRSEFPNDPSQDTHDMTLGDINNDGRMDVVAAGVRGKVIIWINDVIDGEPCFYPEDELDLYSIDFDVDDGGVPGKVVECGDVDQDGYMDLYVNVGETPTIFINNTVSAPYYSWDNIWEAVVDDYQSCASFGWCTYDGAQYLGLAIGSIRHYKPASDAPKPGVAVYIVLDDVLEKVWQSRPLNNIDYQLASDIKWADIDSGGVGAMDIVTGAYPNLDLDADNNLIWNNGFSEYFLDPEMSLPMSNVLSDWNDKLSTLTTSIALGELNSPYEIVHDSYIIDERSWRADEGHRLYYMPVFPLHEITNVTVKLHEKDIGRSYGDSLYYCYDLANGWISFESNEDNRDFFSVIVEFSYSRGLDLVLGNDGPNKAYYNQILNTQKEIPMEPVDCILPEDSCSLSGPSPRVSLMDTTGAVGLTTMYLNDKNMGELLDAHPDVKIISYWQWWKQVEEYRGLYFWNSIDRALSEVFSSDRDINNVILFWAGASSGIDFYYPPEYTTNGASINTFPIDERHSAYTTRNIVNRYRPGGVLAAYQEINGYNFSETAGVTNYMFENEPNLQANGYAYSDNNMSLGFDAIKDKLKYNYGIIHSINPDFKVIAPNFGNTGKEIGDTVISIPDTAYITNLYLDGTLRKYTDIMASQMHQGTSALLDQVGIEDQYDPATDTLLEHSMSMINNIMEQYGDSAKPFIQIEWVYHFDFDLTPNESRNFALTHNAEFFANKRSMWSTFGLIYPENIPELEPSLEETEGINLQARMLNGCRFDTVITYYDTIPACTLTTIHDYVFEKPGANTTYVHQVRTDSLRNEETTRIAMVNDNQVQMDTLQANLVLLSGDEWTRQYGINDPAQQLDVYLKFYNEEIDTIPFWIQEVYDIPDYIVSQSCGLWPGWRLISFNMQPPSLIIDSIFIGTGVDTVRDYQGWTWPEGDLENWDVEQSFLVHLPEEEATCISITSDSLYGETTNIVISPFENDTTISGMPIPYQRFYISYLPQISMPVDSAFKYLLERSLVFWIRNSDGLKYMPDYPALSQRFICHPGEGYDLNLTTEDTVHFNYPISFVPDSWNIGKNYPEEISLSYLETDHFIYRPRTQDVYFIVVDNIHIEGVQIDNGDELGLFTSDGVCCGGRKLMQNQAGFILTAWEDDIATPNLKDGFEWGDEMVFKYYDSSRDTVYETGKSFSVKSSPQDGEPVIAAYSGGFGAGQYSVQSLNFQSGLEALPKTYALHQNYPNPFNPSTTIRFDLPEAGKVSLMVYNIRGQQVANLIDKYYQPGYHSIEWDAESLPSGIYFARMDAEKYKSTRKLLLIK